LDFAPLFFCLFPCLFPPRLETSRPSFRPHAPLCTFFFFEQRSWTQRVLRGGAGLEFFFFQHRSPYFLLFLIVGCFELCGPDSSFPPFIMVPLVRDPGTDSASLCPFSASFLVELPAKISLFFSQCVCHGDEFPTHPPHASSFLPLRHNCSLSS